MEVQQRLIMSIPTARTDIFIDMKDVTCSTDIWGDKLTELATACLRSGKEINDGITFKWYEKDGVNTITADNGIIDVAAFQAAINAVNTTTEASKNAFGVLREDRTKKLAETDWWGASDLTMTDAQKKYRQDLRDLPANTSDPTNPTWPTKPT